MTARVTKVMGESTKMTEGATRSSSTSIFSSSSTSIFSSSSTSISFVILRESGGSSARTRFVTFAGANHEKALPRHWAPAYAGATKITARVTKVMEKSTKMTE